MSVRRWPDSLPVPVGRGYRLVRGDRARRTQFEVAVRARPFTTEAIHRPVLAARLTDAECAAFQAWEGDEPWSLIGASDTLAAWTLTGATRTAAGALGPDEVLCDVLVEDGSTGPHSAQIALAAAGWGAGARAAAVVSLLPLGRAEARVGLRGCDGVLRHARIDLAARAVVAVSGLDWAEAAPHRGWTRVRIAAAVGTGADPVRLRIEAMAGGAVSYAGSGAPALAVGQANARRGGREASLFVPCRADGTALGAAGASAEFVCPVAVGGGITRRPVLPLGPAELEPRPSLAWELRMPVLVRHA